MCVSSARLWFCVPEIGSNSAPVFVVQKYDHGQSIILRNHSCWLAFAHTAVTRPRQQIEHASHGLRTHQASYWCVRSSRRNALHRVVSEAPVTSTRPAGVWSKPFVSGGVPSSPLAAVWHAMAVLRLGVRLRAPRLLRVAHGRDAINSDMRRCSRADTSMWEGPSTGAYCFWIIHTALPP